MTQSGKNTHKTGHRISCLAIAAVCMAGSAYAQQADEVRARWSDGVLTITGTPASDHLSIVSKGNLIEVNGGLVAIVGGTPTTDNTTKIMVDAGAGDDRVVLSEWGSALPDTEMHGQDGNDVLIGQQGNDFLIGGAGNDTLLGGRGNDVVLGEDGNDLLIVNNGDGSDFLEGGEGLDTVQVNGANDLNDEILITSASDGSQVQMGDGAVIFITDSIEAGTVHGHGGDDVMTSKLAANSPLRMDLDGGEGNDLLIGGDGADVLRGGGGNDTLLGNRGNDIVLGQDGNDLLIVNNGDGSDFLEGNGGADTDFLDGGAGQDTTQVIGSARDDQILVTRETGAGGGPHVRVFSGTSGTILFAMEQLDIYAGDGNDSIRGGTGLADLITTRMYGEAGRDIIIANDGTDFVDGGTDRDRCGSTGGRVRYVNCEILMGN